MSLRENIILALRTVRSNWLRAILTLMIIAFGIMALVGILTAIDVGINSLSDNLSNLGANTFDIEPSGEGQEATAEGGEKRSEGRSPTTRHLNSKRVLTSLQGSPSPYGAPVLQPSNGKTKRPTLM